MNPRFNSAFLGALVADAVAMPVHWYYDRNALDRDYGKITQFLAPKNPHPDSILWRSRYSPTHAKADILHKQAAFWGQRSVHYHQFLDAGENTINFKLSIDLYRQIVDDGGYQPELWLERYARLMLDPDYHRDTYLEEYHRGFFSNYAAGKPLLQCGIDDIHIGGLSQIPALMAALDVVGDFTEADAVKNAQCHVALTHKNPVVLDVAETLARLIHQTANGAPVRDAITDCAGRWVKRKKLEAWSRRDDRDVVGNEVSPACYLPGSFVAALYLVWKYADDFSAGVCANAKVGGDSCHRGAVTGSLLGAANGIPEKWLAGLKAFEMLPASQVSRSDT